MRDYADLFWDVGNALRKHGFFLEALRFYEPLKTTDLAIGRSYLQDIAHCYEELRMFDQAEQCYEIILEHDASNADIRLHLTNMFELAGMPERASEQLTKFGNSEAGGHRSLSKAYYHSKRLPVSTAKKEAVSSSRLTLAAYRQTSRRKINQAMHEPRESLAFLHDLDESWLQMKIAKERFRRDSSTSWDSWMDEARIVTDNFKAQPAFFPTERNTRFSGYRKEAGRSSLHIATQSHPAEDDVDAYALGLLDILNDEHS